MVAADRWRTDDVVALFITRFSNDLRGQRGVSGGRLITVLGPAFVASAYPLNGVEHATEGFLAEDESDYLPFTVDGMRETASSRARPLGAPRGNAGPLRCAGVRYDQPPRAARPASPSAQEMTHARGVEDASVVRRAAPG